jgi:hypothetical protein
LKFTGLAVVAFFAVILVQLPASWLRSLLPEKVQCRDLSGTVWQGQCSGMAWHDGRGPPLSVDTLEWALKPWPLFRGRLHAAVTIVRGSAHADANVAASASGAFAITGLQGSAHLDHALLAAFPSGWQGELTAQDISVTLDNNRLLALTGVALVNNLTDSAGNEVGSYRLQIAQSVQQAPYLGQLRDVGGPLDLTATVSVAPDFSWQIDGTIAARGEANPQLAEKLQLLGVADAAGRRPFSVAGTF